MCAAALSSARRGRVDSRDVRRGHTIAFNTLQTLQVFVCSSSEPAQFWELRGTSATNRAFRKEIVDEQLGLLHLFDLLKAPPNTKSEEIAILTLLRDIMPSIPSIRKKRQDDVFHTEFVKLMLVRSTPICA